MYILFYLKKKYWKTILVYLLDRGVKLDKKIDLKEENNKGYKEL